MPTHQGFLQHQKEQLQLFYKTDAPDPQEVPHPSLLCKDDMNIALLSKFHSTDAGGVL